MAKYSVGDVYESEVFAVTSEDVENYAKATDDWQDIHFSDEAAKRMGLESRVVHGGLIIGKALAWAQGLLQGQNAVFRKIQRWAMTKPVLLGQSISFQAKVLNVRKKSDMQAIDLRLKVMTGNKVVNSCVLKLLIS